MKTPQFPTSKLSASSEYALILGAGASAAMSLAAQQVAAASLPVTALVAIGLLNRRRLDQRLNDSAPAETTLEVPSARQAPKPSESVTAQPTPELLSAQSLPSVSAIDNPLAARFSHRYKHAEGKIAARQQTSLQTIGAQLRQVRQSKALSLRDIHDLTFIQIYMLEAIEVGNLRGLPEPFYVRAFIQKYASALGLKGFELASEFPVS